MRILFVCHRLPYPPTRGGKIRPFHIISHLSGSHDVTVASIARSDQEMDEGKGLSEHCSKVLVGRISATQAALQMILRLATPVPSSMGNFYSPQLQRLISDELNSAKYGLIFVHCSSVAQYVSSVSEIPKVLDFGDMDSQKWLMYGKFRRFPISLGYQLEGLKLQREEARLAKHFDLCTCTTVQELDTLNSYHTGTNTAWFPNGVDHNYFRPGSEAYDPDLISFIGRMDYYPNQQAMIGFCERILPIIRRRRPGANLIIVGANPPGRIRRLAKMDGVTVTGSVPDVRPLVTKSAVNVVPLQIARGTQNKILEAMAMGVPVVTTSMAAAGVDAIPGKHFLCGEVDQEFAEMTLRVLENQEDRRTLAAEARERMLDRHDWGRSMDRLDRILHQYASAEKSDKVTHARLAGTR